MLLYDHPLYKELASSNQELDENEIKNLTLGSKKKLLWVCSRHHEYSATVYHRVNGSNCPYCSGIKILPGFNDLNTLEPNVAAQWHPSRNELSPELVARSSKQKYWWVCDKGHEWEATPKSRVMNGSNCPYCSKNRILSNSFLPILFKEYDTTKNNKPLSLYRPKSNEKVWWVCEKNNQHTWKTKIYLRNDPFKGTQCPYCNYSNRSSAAEKELKAFFNLFQ